MKLPDVLESFFQKKSDSVQVYLSLYLDVHSVAAAFWSMGTNGSYKMLGVEHTTFKKDDWGDRCDTIDRLLGLLEGKTGHTDVTKAILGLPTTYLTPTGEINKDVRTEIKNLTRSLELEPIGFVPLHQAVIYKMKKDEGVPPSVILLGINNHTIAVTLYKIGSLIGIRDIEKHEDIAMSVEQGLKSFTDLEVLPARMLLYGSDASELEEIKVKLLRHQWTSKVNFLHFPKIEVISLSTIIESVSFAGASELGSGLGTEETKESVAPPPAVSAVARAKVAEKTPPDDELTETTAEEKEEVQPHIEPDTHVSISDSTPHEDAEESESMTEEVADAQEVLARDFAASEPTAHADANVVMVDAESLGFKKDVDILEEENQLKEAEIEAAQEDQDDDLPERARMPAMPRIHLAGFFRMLGRVSLFSGVKGSRFIIVAGFVVFIAVSYVLYYILPHASVRVLSISQMIESAETITIDPTATIVDAQNKIIPGKKREKSISGDKTVDVQGKKNVGDPARGSVTVYNKALSSRTFKKGTILASGSLQFTLDSDVQIASASESVGSITFGKRDVNVTAVAIGTAGNLPGGNEFTFKDTSSSTAIARNDKAFAGGSSREITVVTRGDYDEFVKDMSEELVGKAKEELSSSVEGSEKLVDSTIKTTVTEKVFVQEIDEEAKQLQGKLTLTVSGIAYSEVDVQALLTTVAASQISSGYMINDAKTTITVSDVQVKKDGKMTAKATMSATALPTLDVGSIRKSLAGKSLKSVENYLRGLPGVGGVEVSFRLSPTKDRLPINKQNISVTISEAR